MKVELIKTTPCLSIDGVTIHTFLVDGAKEVVVTAGTHAELEDVIKFVREYCIEDIEDAS